MIPRYTLPEMGALWTEQARFEAMLRVEIAVLRALVPTGAVPPEALAAIESRGRVDVERINELERTTDHDVIAFVSQVAETVGPEGRWLHYGLTSSDVVDTALALQCRAAADLILGATDAAIAVLVRRAREHADTLQMGRTHSVHAEPITFGLKLASWAFELDRDRTRLRAAADDLATGKISGPVGTYSQLGPAIESAALADLGRRVGLSERSVSRLFPIETGLTLHRWRQQARLMRAFALMEEGHAVTRVALELGYGSPAAFGKMFRKLTGRSPREAARARQGKS